ncbi:proto-oncogene tyrosine-protein kinase ROS-like [Acipenser oxyrinchus oxyrinchus]|uniref:Proto-oncogene tyrosine-protein kinase ROS-like n=1 Tax=Acipenser oxyrinchus oxyrinchus TaxID=40147 RepID=A0AAD8DGI4_ACIOX|nr:proto-oncogene tyrosine-protein kinase ROS-like [Acipenser oxyrinchus oxyrinchus]
MGEIRKFYRSYNCFSSFVCVALTTWILFLNGCANGNVRRICQDSCKSSLEMNTVESDWGCDIERKLFVCSDVCSQWNYTSLQDCFSRCVSILLSSCCFLQVQFCRVGCENIHENNDCSKSETGSVSQQPVASSVGATYMTLKWKTENSSDRLYVIQWRYTEIPGDWSSTEPVRGSMYNVTGLHPYTEYVFRVGWLGSHSFCTLSLDSRPYRTAAAGVPSSPPEISYLDSPSPSSVFVRWMPPLFPGGPVTGYLLQLRNDKESFYREVNGQRQNYSFHFTKPATTYRFSVAARNREGVGPAAVSNITTVAQPAESPPHPVAVTALCYVQK